MTDAARLREWAEGVLHRCPPGVHVVAPKEPCLACDARRGALMVLAALNWWMEAAGTIDEGPQAKAMAVHLPLESK